MSIQEVNRQVRPGKKGGGLLGSILGGLGGVILGGLTGGLAAPAGAVLGAAAGGALTGAGLGEKLGGIVGEKVDPSKAPEQMGGPTNMETPRNRLQTVTAPEVSMAQMQDSKNLLAQSNVPNAQDYMGMIDQAQAKLKQQIGSTSYLG